MTRSQVALLLLAYILWATTVSGQSTSLTKGVSATTIEYTHTVDAITFSATAPTTLNCGSTTASASSYITISLPKSVIFSIVVTNKDPAGSIPIANMNSPAMTVTLSTNPTATICTGTDPIFSGSNVGTWTCDTKGATVTDLVFKGAKGVGLCNVQILVLDPTTTTATTATIATTTVKSPTASGITLAARLDWTVLLVTLLAAVIASIGTQKV